jgi:hypothetical protein
MTLAELQTKVDACRVRISATEAEREAAIGKLIDAAPTVRQLVVQNFDDRITAEHDMIENFEWAIRQGGL